MPISGPYSYLPTTDEFLSHWSTVNSELGAATPLHLAGGINHAALLALRTQLLAQWATVESTRNNREAARAAIESRKAQLLTRLNQFNLKLEAMQPGSVFLLARPKAYSLTEAMGRVVPPLQDIADVWQKAEVEGDAALILPGNYSLAQFNADFTSLKGNYLDYQAADNDLKFARGRRNETQEKIKPILKNYRQRITADYLPGSAVYESLPRLHPLPGHTPAPVQLSGVFSATDQSANLTWSASADPDLQAYEVRATVGPEYEADDAEILALITPAQARQWAGTFGLALPGSAASFKVFVILTSGNEAGSNEVTLTRPI